VLKQDGGWTYGALANHLWSFSGDDQRADVNATFVQPFHRQWSVPVNLLVTKVTEIGGQLFSGGGGLRWWADGPESGPHGVGVRLVVSLLFPK
jgi:hypothetical protein